MRIAFEGSAELRREGARRLQEPTPETGVMFVPSSIEWLFPLRLEHVVAIVDGS
ncbi:MAG: hypothetical protein HY791_34400 [Deltaproteobacteria bacterium]|nr:hypothetical protein [Deltaproteobacteria bacterium]